jgi:hypothetical protein
MHYAFYTFGTFLAIIYIEFNLRRFMMKKLLLMIAMLGAFVFASCAKNIPSELNNPEAGDKPAAKGCTPTDVGVGSDGEAAYGAHFKNWMQNNGYSDLASIEGWGGKQYSSDCDAYYQPVIFIHGNGGYAQSSWEGVREDFLQGNGSTYYYPSEVYAIGWGKKGTWEAADNHHRSTWIKRIRRFMDAVKAYTGAAEVDMIAHSMGVTLTKAAIKGGTYYDAYCSGSPNYRCNSEYVGGSKGSMVDAFVGIAGGNRGLNSCGWWDGGTATWSWTCWDNGLSIDNPFIDSIGYGADSNIDYVASIYSWVDEIVCNGSCYVWYVHTSRIDGQDGYKSFSTAPYGHFGVKNYTANYQIDMVLTHDDDGSY